MNLADIQKRVLASSSKKYLLDEYPNAAAAYSLRKLRSGYTGNCIEVRRSSDNTTQNIGFVNDVLDTASLLSFVGAGNGFVRTWYDQSGNGRNASQTTNSSQPQIVINGTLELDNGKSAINFASGGNTWFSLATRISNINSIFYILNAETQTGTNTQFLLGDSEFFDYHAGSISNFILWTGVPNYVQGGNNYLNGALSNFTTTNRPLNQALLTLIHTSASGRANRISRDRTENGRSWQGKIQELVIYSMNQSTNRSGIQSNINAYYNIY